MGGMGLITLAMGKKQIPKPWNPTHCHSQNHPKPDPHDHAGKQKGKGRKNPPDHQLSLGHEYPEHILRRRDQHLMSNAELCRNDLPHQQQTIEKTYNSLCRGVFFFAEGKTQIDCLHKSQYKQKSPGPVPPLSFPAGIPAAQRRQTAPWAIPIISVSFCLLPGKQIHQFLSKTAKAAASRKVFRSSWAF